MALPVAEEKQILDAIKIVLENGYCLGEYEIIQIFDIIGLRGFAQQEPIIGQNVVEEENRPFMQFIEHLTSLFNLNEQLIKEYLTIKATNAASIL